MLRYISINVNTVQHIIVNKNSSLVDWSINTTIQNKCCIKCLEQIDSNDIVHQVRRQHNVRMYFRGIFLPWKKFNRDETGRARRRYTSHRDCFLSCTAVLLYLMHFMYGAYNKHLQSFFLHYWKPHFLYLGFLPSWHEVLIWVREKRLDRRILPVHCLIDVWS